MPIFEFQCKKCRKDFEELLPNSDVSKVACPLCKSKNIKRKLSVFGCVSTPATGGCESAGGCPMKHQCGSNCHHE